MAHISDSGLRQFYHGTRAVLKPGDLIEPGHSAEPTDDGRVSNFVHLVDTLDAASWQGETGPGEGPGRIYVVEPMGPITDGPDLIEGTPPGLTRSYLSREPLRVTVEVTDSQGRPPLLYHGTKADLGPGDLIEPGHAANFGGEDRVANFVYLAGTLDAAVWGAELARGDGPARIYVVDPIGPIADDPNVTNKKFRGNPTKSHRSREPLLVTEEVTAWQGHAPEVLEAMRDGLKQLEERGEDAIDD
jgi:hypothetical protein